MNFYKKILLSFLFNLSLFSFLLIGIQNSNQKSKVNFIINQSVELPISFIMGRAEGAEETPRIPSEGTERGPAAAKQTISAVTTRSGGQRRRRRCRKGGTRVKTSRIIRNIILSSIIVISPEEEESKQHHHRHH